jgi:hypothetical protein
MQDFAREVEHPCGRQWPAKSMEGRTDYCSPAISRLDKLRQVLYSFFKVSFFHILDFGYRPNNAPEATSVGRFLFIRFEFWFHKILVRRASA